MDIDIHQSQDKLFKVMLGNKKIACDFFRKRLSPDLVSKIDFDSLRLTSASFVSKEMKSRYNDLVYSARINGESGYLYTLIEAQSTEKREQALYLMECNVHLLRQHMAQQPEDTKLPCIVNLVLYSGKQKYQGPQSVAEAFSDPTLFCLNLQRPFLINLAEEDEGALLQQGEASLVQLLLKYGHVRDLCNLLAENKVILELIDRSPYWLEAMLYVIDRDQHDPEEVLKKLRILNGNRKDKVMNNLQKIKQEGRQEGIQEGLKAGMQEGFKKGKLELLQRLLDQKMITPEQLIKLLKELLE